MSEIIDTNIVESSEEKEFNVTIKVSNQNLSYKSDFQESETIFWLEAVKSLILKNAFDRTQES
jgi:hypothetical protein